MFISADDGLSWFDGGRPTLEPYFASARFAQPQAEDDDEGVPAAVQLGAGALVGVGLAMLIVPAVSRRRSQAAQLRQPGLTATPLST